jgi:hypothetical protein
MSTHCVVADRPEDRRRLPEPPMWADTMPGWFRSEAFVEDLPAPHELAQPRGARAARATAGPRHHMAWSAASAVLQQTRSLWFFRPE